MRADKTTLHDQQFYTIAEVSQLLRISERHLRRLIKSGQLKSVPAGLRAVRIRETDLDAFLARKSKARS